MNDAYKIAQTIIAQIGGNSLACLGVPRNSIRVVPPTIDADENGHLGGVQFKFTNCPKVRSGTVVITLDGVDTYNVTIKNVLGRVLKDMKGVYCDMIGRDGVIEEVTG